MKGRASQRDTCAVPLPDALIGKDDCPPLPSYRTKLPENENATDVPSILPNRTLPFSTPRSPFVPTKHRLKSSPSPVNSNGASLPDKSASEVTPSGKSP